MPSGEQCPAVAGGDSGALPETAPPAGAKSTEAPTPMSKEEKLAERQRKAEVKEEERLIKEAQRKAREEAKAAKAADLAAERERKRAERLLREAEAEEARRVRKAETERKEAERKAKLEEKERERERKARELEAEREEATRRAAEAERKRQKSSLFAAWGKKPPAKLVIDAATSAPDAAAAKASESHTPGTTERAISLLSSSASLPKGTILLRGGRVVRAYQPPDEYTQVAPAHAFRLDLDAARLDEQLARGAGEAQLELHGRRRRPMLNSRKRKRSSDASILLQPWQLARYKYLKPDCDSIRPPYWGTWTKQSKNVRARRPFGRDEKLDYEIDSEDDWEEEGEGEDLGSEDEVEDMDLDRSKDNDGLGEEDGDGFVVDDGYLSEDERTHADGDCASAAGQLRTAAGPVQPKRVNGRLVPQLVINLWPSEGKSPAEFEAYAVKVVAPLPLVLEPCDSSEDPAPPKHKTPKNTLSAAEQLALAEMIHGSPEGILQLCERFRTAHSGHSRGSIESKIREMATRTKRLTAAGEIYDAISIWIVNKELAEGLGLEDPPPSRSRSRTKYTSIDGAPVGTPSLDSMVKKQAAAPTQQQTNAAAAMPRSTLLAVPISGAAKASESEDVEVPSSEASVAAEPPTLKATPAPTQMPLSADVGAGSVTPAKQAFIERQIPKDDNISPNDARPRAIASSFPATASHAAKSTDKPRSGSLNAFFSKGTSSQPSPETGSYGSKTESRTISASDRVQASQPSPASEPRQPIGLAATDPYVAELMAASGSKKRQAETAATSTHVEQSTPAAPSKTAQMARCETVNLEAAKEAILAHPLVSTPSPSECTDKDLPPSSTRGRKKEALPPGWTEFHISSKTGKTQYTRYAGPRGRKVITKTEAWRLYRLQEAAGAAPKGTSRAMLDATCVKLAGESEESVGESVAVVTMPTVHTAIETDAVAKRMQVEQSIVEDEETFSWEALEQKLNEDISDAPVGALHSAWSDSSNAATPSRGVLHSLVLALDPKKFSTYRRDASLRCLGDCLVEWQRLNSSGDVVTKTTDSIALTAQLGAHLLGAPELAPHLLLCVVDDDLQLRKNAWRCVHLLLSQRCPTETALEQSGPLAQRVQAFGESLTSKVWVDAMVDQAKEDGRHAQYAAGTLLALVSLLGMGELLLAARNSLLEELASALAAGIEKVATAKFCVQALVQLASERGERAHLSASAVNAAVERVVSDFPKLEGETVKLRQLVLS